MKCWIKCMDELPKIGKVYEVKRSDMRSGKAFYDGVQWRRARSKTILYGVSYWCRHSRLQRVIDKVKRWTPFVRS